MYEELDKPLSREESFNETVVLLVPGTYEGELPQGPLTGLYLEAQGERQEDGSLLAHGIRVVENPAWADEEPRKES